MNIFIKNPLLAWLGTAMLVLFLAEFIFSFYDKRILTGVSIWVKPMKFSLATWVFTWTMAYILSFLDNPTKVSWISWIICFAMVIEIVLIVFQAIRGEKSHFNVSSALNSAIFSIMGSVITINTIAIGFVAVWFFTDNITLPTEMLWAIRLALVMFIIFSLEGFVMGALLKHSVGTEDGIDKGIFFLNWNTNFGDLRVAHFIGMHSLQAVPVFALLIIQFKDKITQPYSVLLILLFAALYFSVSALAFFRAMQGKPLLFN